MVRNPFKKKKNPFEASMPLDKPEVKVVEARYDKKPFLVAVGVAKQRDVKGTGGVGTEGVKGEYKSQKDFDWQVLYNLKVLPEGFIPEQKLKDWMAGTIAVTSGNPTVFSPDTKFIETEEQKFKEMNLQNWLAMAEERKKKKSFKSSKNNKRIHIPQ
jgi:hypothetical protein